MKRMTRILALLMICAVLMGIAMPVLAEEKPELLIRTLWANCEMETSVDVINMPENARITSVKSSKPSVLRVKKETWDGETYFFLWPVKAGTSVLTVKLKVGKKTTTLKGTYVVKDYPNPLETLLINGSKVDLGFYRKEYSIRPYKDTKATIKATPASGWRIREMHLVVNYAQPKRIKNGKAFKFPKGADAYVDIMLESNAGDSFEYYVGFNH